MMSGAHWFRASVANLLAGIVLVIAGQANELSQTEEKQTKHGSFLDRFRGKPSGRLEWDVASLVKSDPTGNLDGRSVRARLRRVRLAYELAMGDQVPAILKADFGFASGTADIKDLYVGFKNVPTLGLVRAGNLKEPTTLEGTMSSRFVTFMERGLPVATFWPERNLGLSIGRALPSQRTTWQLAAFFDDELSFESDIKWSSQSGNRFSGRLTGLPLNRLNDESPKLIHVGVSGTIVNPRDDTVQYTSNPESSLAPQLLDTGSIRADQNLIMALEAAYVEGPFSLQTEYIGNWVRQPQGSTAFLNGYYVSGSWLLTGESRTYKPKSGEFGGIIPKHNFSFAGGAGAWELAMRFSHLNLSDSGIAGGRLNDFTGGINWILTPQMRMQFNYVLSRFKRAPATGFTSGKAHTFQARWHVHF